MKQLNLPKRQVALVQVLVSLLLIILTLIMSLTPILTIDLSDNEFINAVEDSMGAISENVDGVDEIEIPDKIDITMPKLLKADMILVKLIKVMINSAKETNTLSTSELEKIEKEQDALQEMIESKEGKEALVSLVAALGQVIDFSELGEEKTEEEKEEKSSLGDTIMLLIRVIALLFILIFITIIPVIVGIAALVNLIRVLKNLKSPQNVCSKVSGVTITYLSFVVLFAIVLTLFDGMEFGSGLSAILVFSLINIVVNVAATRLRSYESADFRFVNVTQGTALLGGIGAIIFLVNLLKINVLNGFFGAFGSYLEEVSNETDVINLEITAYNMLADENISSFKASTSYIIDLVIIAVFAIMALSIAMSAISVCVARIGLATSDSKKRESGYVSVGIGAIITSILPFALGMLKSAKHFELEDIVDGRAIINETVDGAIYNISSETKSAAIAMLIGAILILAAGIIDSILKKKLCPEITEERAALILHGKAPENNE